MKSHQVETYPSRKKTAFFEAIFGFCLMANLSLYAESTTTKTITVQKGETLTSISKEHLSDPSKWKELLKYNNIPNPNLIRPGLKLVIPDYLGKEPIAITNFVMGKVEYRKGEGNLEWTTLKKGVELFPLDSIKTNPKSNTDITIKNSGLVRVYPNSLVQVRYLQKEDAPPEVNLRKGSLDAFISKIIPTKGKPVEKFRVVTPSAVASVRGTEFRVDLDSGENSTIACYEGMVAVSAEGKTVELEKGFATFVEKGKAPTDPYKIPDPPLLKE